MVGMANNGMSKKYIHMYKYKTTIHLEMTKLTSTLTRGQITRLVLISDRVNRVYNINVNTIGILTVTNNLKIKVATIFADLNSIMQKLLRPRVITIKTNHMPLPDIIFHFFCERKNTA